MYLPATYGPYGQVLAGPGSGAAHPAGAPANKSKSYVTTLTNNRQMCLIRMRCLRWSLMPFSTVGRAPATTAIAVHDHAALPPGQWGME
jgi:hypothetical protein